MRRFDSVARAFVFEEKVFSLTTTTTPTPLPGGQGHSFLSGSTVLKYISPNEAEEAEWTSHTLSLLPPSPHFTIPTPIPSPTGHYVYESWTATQYHPGTDHPVGHWDELFEAARHFHKALEGVPEPGFLRRCTHPWARADRAAWGEESASVVPSLAPLYERLLSLRKKVGVVEAQLVYGDLSGNMLFCDGKALVVIDFSPFWRGVDYAAAIAVVDGVADFGEGEGVLGVAGLGGMGDGGWGDGGCRWWLGRWCLGLWRGVSWWVGWGRWGRGR